MARPLPAEPTIAPAGGPWWSRWASAAGTVLRAVTVGALFALGSAHADGGSGPPPDLGRWTGETVTALPAAPTAPEAGAPAGPARNIEVAGLPVYILFFTVAGTTLHLGALASVWLPTVLVVLVRAGGLLSGSAVGALLAGAAPAVWRNVGFGLPPQAGLALALTTLVAQSFPEFGADAARLALSVVAINELAAPLLYRLALVRSGEAGRGRPSADTPAHGVAQAETGAPR